jgi:hypothetical protein
LSVSCRQFMEAFMNNELSFYDNVEGLERYLNLPPNSLRNIPI